MDFDPEQEKAFMLKHIENQRRAIREIKGTERVKSIYIKLALDKTIKEEPKLFFNKK